MHPFFAALLAPIRNLNVVIKFPAYFDPNERRLVVTSIIIGVATWAIVHLLRVAVHDLFHQTLHWIDHASTPLLVFIPLLLGAAIVATIVNFRSSIVHYRDGSGHIHELLDVEGDGIERTIALYYASEPALEQALLGKEGVDVRWELPTLSMALRKFAATLVTLGSGGSGGLEGSVALIGESMATTFFKPRPFLDRLPDGPIARWWKWWRSNRTDALQTAQLAGVAAAVSTLLGSPLAAAFFATEIMYRRRPVIEKLLYALVAALTAFLLGHLLTSAEPGLFHVTEVIQPPANLIYYLAVIVMALAVSLVDAYFSRMQESFAESFHRLIPNIWLRHLCGAAITGLIALIAVLLTGHGFDIVLGPGESVVEEALEGNLAFTTALVALVAKLFATLSTIGSGGSAGLLVPSIFFGAMTAMLVAAAFGLPTASLIIPSITASLVTTVNVPLAAIVFTIEAFGASYMIPSLVALVVSLLFAYENSIYRTQREWDQGRTILPGYSVQRISVPRSWAGRTISDLGLRVRYDVNVIGMIEVDPPEHLPIQQRIRPEVTPSRPLKLGDLLIVLGRDDNIETLLDSMDGD